MKVTHLIILALAAAAFGPATLIARTDDVSLPSEAELEKIALKHPAPDYPKKIRAGHFTGKGVFDIQVDARTGKVIDVSVNRSTGSAVLDQSAVEALKHWLFRTNSVVRVRVPIEFTLQRKDG